MNPRPEQSEKKGVIPRSENKKAMTCNKRSSQRPKLTAINKQKGLEAKGTIVPQKIGEQIDD